MGVSPIELADERQSRRWAPQKMVVITERRRILLLGGKGRIEVDGRRRRPVLK
jgi:hypothetical protein